MPTRNHDACHQFMTRSVKSFSWSLVMKENILVELSKQFAVDIVNICTDIKENRKSNVLINQILRSGTSVGANIHEANYAASKADFINKFHIALKECVETEYWIEMLVGSNCITEAVSKELLNECGIIRRMLVKSVNTAKKKLDIISSIVKRLNSSI